MTNVNASDLRGDLSLALGDPGNVDSLLLDLSSLSISNYLINTNRYYFAFNNGSLTGSLYIYGKNLPSISDLESLTTFNNLKGDVTGFDIYLNSNGTSLGGYKVSSLDISLQNFLNFSPSEFEEVILKYDDEILGSTNSDIIFSQSGSDSITALGGDDKIDGGEGLDTSIYTGMLKNYEIKESDGVFTVEDIRTNSKDGVDLLTNIEYLKFSDKTIPIYDSLTVKDVGERNQQYSIYLSHDRNINFSSIYSPKPIKVSAYEIGKETNLYTIKDYDGNLHAGDNLAATVSSYKYQGMLDVNGDGVFEMIFTNKSSKRWVTAKVDSTTCQVDFNDNGPGGGTRVVGIYEDPLIAEGNSNNGFLSDGVTPAPANFGVSEEERYVEVNGERIDRLALNSQVRFQNDLDNDNLTAKHSGDYDFDGIHEVYWITNDGTAYLRALMHDDGNIRYANYQNKEQMVNYLTINGCENVISDII